MQQQLTINDLFGKSRDEWLEEARTAARKLLQTKPNITIEDVLEVCPKPQYIHRNTIGSVFKNGEFTVVGYTKSRRAVSNGRHIFQWRLK